MPAATTERNTVFRESLDFEFPVAASTRILQGVMVQVNASSVAVEAAATVANRTVGVAMFTANNLSGAAGALRVQVRRGCYQFANSSAGDLIALKDVGQPCYVVDNQTVALTSATNTRPVAGTIRDVDANGVWVEF